MYEQLPIQNPYEQIYKNCIKQAGREGSNRRQAQNIIKNLGYMYNTFGLAIKDFIRILANQLNQEKQTKKITTNNVKKQAQYIDHYQQRKGIDKKTTKNKRNAKCLPIQTNDSILTNFNNVQPLQMQNKREKIQSKFNKQQILAPFQLQQIVKIKEQKEEEIIQFSSQILQLQSPKKQAIENEQQAKYCNIFQLSHKQKFQDPSFITAQEEDQASFILADNLINNEEKNDKQSKKWENKKNQNVRIMGGKKKKDREKLMGVTCIQCEKYYKVMQIQNKGQNMCQCTSRHRTNLPVKRMKNQFTQQFDLK